MPSDNAKPGDMVGHAPEKAAATAGNPDKCTQHGLASMNNPDAPGGMVGHHAKAPATAAETAAATVSAYQTDPAKEMQRQQNELMRQPPKRSKA